MRRLSAPLVTALVTATAAVLVAGAATAPVYASERPKLQAGSASHGAPPAAQVWVTTVDRAELMHQRQPVTFTRRQSDLTTITIDPRRTFQVMDGFGAALTDSSAALLHRLPVDRREAVMRSLFAADAGIGVSVLRQPIGSSDFTAETRHYTYDDVPTGQTDFALAHFSIARDERQILPLLRQAKRINPRLVVIASPWSPPAWMKTSQSLVGGRLIDDPAIYRVYARYLAKFVHAYTAAGVPIDYVTIQNEPQNRTPREYPGTDLPADAQNEVIRELGPMLRAISPRTKILSYDHNWATHPDDIATTPPGADPETDYPYRALAGDAARWVAGTAYHCYYGDPSAQTALHEANPGKGIWFTECSGSHGPSDPPAKVFRDTLTWHARMLTVGTTRNWAKSLLTWNLALDQSGGPHLGGCDTCTGLLTVNDDGSVSTNAEYYTIGHLARFVRNGAVRIASTSYGTTGWNGQIMDVAFRNPDGSTALVVHNQNDDPRSFTVAVGDWSFDYTVPGGSLVTFTWPRSRLLTDDSREVPLEHATATARPSGDQTSAAAVVDSDGSTRWTTGEAQAPGQYLQIDLGSARVFRRVALDSGGNLGEFAKGWQITISNDGVRWRTAATGTGTGQLTTVDLGRTRARFVRVTTTMSADTPWTVSEVRLSR